MGGATEGICWRLDRARLVTGVVRLEERGSSYSHTAIQYLRANLSVHRYGTLPMRGSPSLGQSLVWRPKVAGTKEWSGFYWPERGDERDLVGQQSIL